ncbi:hypothetical protein CTI12_AA532660 [Artemisia annua]|uniref:Uncharacterized protein n=1 Tax=Artemisia annua TaxID=35608 RepID=A0A2U1KS54_ARTAN|nr:hypothetical protein CTI12_AA532660 [Artemisia annua]
MKNCGYTVNNGDYTVKNGVNTVKNGGYTVENGGYTANPVEIGKFLFKDGKVFTLARISSPSRNCVGLGEYCGALDWCCDPYSCNDGFWPIIGRCV